MDHMPGHILGLVATHNRAEALKSCRMDHMPGHILGVVATHNLAEVAVLNYYRSDSTRS